MVQAFEADANTEVILGLGARTPSVPFERAEFVRSDQNYSILNRIVKATQVDTILHTFLVTNSATVPNRALHEINVIGTMNLLAAAGAAGTSVRHIVVKSSTLVYGSSARDPNTFEEETPRSRPATHSIERALLEAESLVRDFSEDNPGTLVTVLRFANEIEDGGMEWPDTDAIGPEGWHYQLRATMAAASTPTTRTSHNSWCARARKSSC